MPIDKTNFSKLYSDGYICSDNNLPFCDCELCEIVRLCQQFQKENQQQAEQITAYKEAIAENEMTTADQQGTLDEQEAEIAKLRKRFAKELQQDTIDELNQTGRHQPY